MGVKLIDNTEKIKAALRGQIAIGLNSAAQFFTSEAKAGAAVDTGFMKEHIGVTGQATAQRLETEVRSLARYSGPQDTGVRGNLFFTRAYYATREKFAQFLYGKIQVGTVGGNIIRAAEEEFHGSMGRKGQGF